MAQKEQAETKLEEKMDRWVYLNDLAEQMGMKDNIITYACTKCLYTFF